MWHAATAVPSVPPELDSSTQEPQCHAGKRDADCRRFGPEAFAAGDCAHLEGEPGHHPGYAQKGAHQARLSFARELVPALLGDLGDAVEIDELVVRLKRKRRYRYLWVAVSRVTRQVLAWCLGSRSEATLRRLWWSVPGPYRRKLLYSDPYEAHGAFFRAWQHRVVNKGSGKTSVVEGLNNKWRSRVSGLVRKTVCVQHEADLQCRLWLVITQHNHQCRQRVEKLGWLPPSTP